jgi:hypothetical protein
VTEQGNPHGRIIVDHGESFTVSSPDGLYQITGSWGLDGDVAASVNRAVRKAVDAALSRVYDGVQSLGPLGLHSQSQINRADALGIITQVMRENRENGDQS